MINSNLGYKSLFFPLLKSIQSFSSSIKSSSFKASATRLSYMIAASRSKLKSSSEVLKSMKKKSSSTTSLVKSLETSFIIMFQESQNEISQKVEKIRHLNKKPHIRMYDSVEVKRNEIMNNSKTLTHYMGPAT